MKGQMQFDLGEELEGIRSTYDRNLHELRNMDFCLC